MVSSGLSKPDIDIVIRRNFVEFRFTCTEGTHKRNRDSLSRYLDKPILLPRTELLQVPGQYSWPKHLGERRSIPSNHFLSVNHKPNRVHNRAPPSRCDSISFAVTTIFFPCWCSSVRSFVRFAFWHVACFRAT